MAKKPIVLDLGNYTKYTEPMGQVQDRSLNWDHVKVSSVNHPTMADRLGPGAKERLKAAQSSAASAAVSVIPFKPILLSAAALVGGYFLYKKLKK